MKESYSIDDSNGIDKTWRNKWICLYFTVDLDTPVITLTSGSKTITEGRALKFTCNAIGSESIVYNWLLPNRTTVNSNILQIDNINRSDAGNYNCTASSTVKNKILRASTTSTITVFCKWTVIMFFCST